jgi:hypothetical protein
MHTITFFNPTSGKIENMTAISRTVSLPDRRNEKVSDYNSLIDQYKAGPITSVPIKSLAQQSREFNTPVSYSVTPYSKSAEHNAAQDAMKMLDAIISPKKN